MPNRSHTKGKNALSKISRRNIIFNNLWGQFISDDIPEIMREVHTRDASILTNILMVKHPSHRGNHKKNVMQVKRLIEKYLLRYPDQQGLNGNDKHLPADVGNNETGLAINPVVVPSLDDDSSTQEMTVVARGPVASTIEQLWPAFFDMCQDYNGRKRLEKYDSYPKVRIVRLSEGQIERHSKRRKKSKAVKSKEFISESEKSEDELPDFSCQEDSSMEKENNLNKDPILVKEDILNNTPSNSNDFEKTKVSKVKTQPFVPLFNQFLSKMNCNYQNINSKLPNASLSRANLNESLDIAEPMVKKLKLNNGYSKPSPRFVKDRSRLEPQGVGQISSFCKAIATSNLNNKPLKVDKCTMTTVHAQTNSVGINTDGFYPPASDQYLEKSPLLVDVGLNQILHGNRDFVSKDILKLVNLEDCTKGLDYIDEKIEKLQLQKKAVDEESNAMRVKYENKVHEIQKFIDKFYHVKYQLLDERLNLKCNTSYSIKKDVMLKWEDLILSACKNTEHEHRQLPIQEPGCENRTRNDNELFNKTVMEKAGPSCSKGRPRNLNTENKLNSTIDTARKHLPAATVITKNNGTSKSTINYTVSSVQPNLLVPGSVEVSAPSNSNISSMQNPGTVKMSNSVIITHHSNRIISKPLSEKSRLDLVPGHQTISQPGLLSLNTQSSGNNTPPFKNNNLVDRNLKDTSNIANRPNYSSNASYLKQGPETSNQLRKHFDQKVSARQSSMKTVQPLNKNNSAVGLSEKDSSYNANKPTVLSHNYSTSIGFQNQPLNKDNSAIGLSTKDSSGNANKPSVLSPSYSTSIGFQNQNHSARNPVPIHTNESGLINNQHASQVKTLPASNVIHHKPIVNSMQYPATPQISVVSLPTLQAQTPTQPQYAGTLASLQSGPLVGSGGMPTQGSQWVPAHCGSSSMLGQYLQSPSSLVHAPSTITQRYSQHFSPILPKSGNDVNSQLTRTVQNSGGNNLGNCHMPTGASSQMYMPSNTSQQQMRFPQTSTAMSGGNIPNPAYNTHNQGQMITPISSVKPKNIQTTYVAPQCSRSRDDDIQEINTCFLCGKDAAMRCCGSFIYCSRSCKDEDFERHERECKALRR